MKPIPKPSAEPVRQGTVLKGSWQWFVLQVIPGKEFVAEVLLSDAGFDVFVPIKHVLVRIARPKKKYVQARPLYPGYVLIGFDQPRIPWREVTSFDVVLGILKQGNQPRTIPEGVIRAVFANSSRVRYHLNNKQGRERRGKNKRLVNVSNGPFQGRLVRAVDHGDEAQIWELFTPDRKSVAERNINR